MKAYKISVVATKTMLVTEDEYKNEGGIGEFDEFAASQYVKGCLIEDLTNDPNRGSVKIIFELDY